MSTPFNWASGIATGTSHLASGVPCQDAIAIRDVTSTDTRHYVIGAVSDGAGSAAHAEEGARYAVDIFVDFVAEALAEFDDIDLSDIAERGARLVHAALGNVADHRDRSSFSYAATFLGCVSDAERTAFVQIGDGEIVTKTGQRNWQAVFRPQHGEYVNVSHFITDTDALNRIQVEVCDEPITQVVMFSDGLEEMFLKAPELDVHPPLFEHVRHCLTTWRGCGEHETLSAQIDEILRSKAVTKRTDDDVSLLAINFERDAP